MELIFSVISYTPNLFKGLSLNLLISIVAMSIGTFLGYFLAKLRSARYVYLSQLGNTLNNICRNVPSFVLIFYMAFLIPVEIITPIQWPLIGTVSFWTDTIEVYSISPWIKGSMALVIPVIGFSGDLFFNQLFKNSHLNPNQEKIDISYLCVSWVNYLIIIIMASATVSVIGIQEIVGVANSIIATQADDAYFRLGLYIYVAFWFLCLGILVNGCLFIIKKTAH
ncbi:hypothetical protein [Marinicellulosiphila megalodicopiae]|uniref:hypothetical protein n=1 Tax=Marinicellulosiphila megalodicopiae TaxID=2724896 RepID=UPI003BAFC224